MGDLIKQISLSKEEERKLNESKYKSLFTPNSYYSNMFEQEKKRLALERINYNSDMDFYRGVALQFAKQYIPQIVSDYSDKINEDTVKKLSNIISGDGLKIFKPGEAIEQGYIKLRKNGTPSGDGGAFAISEFGIIGFTPESENSKLDLTNKTKEELNGLVINNALRMIGSMIHETFHLIIKVKRDEHFYWMENGVLKSQLTSGGFIIDEGVVEKFAIDFSLKHKFPLNPALDYFHYVELCNELEKRMGKEKFEEISFNSDYIQLLQNSHLTQEQFNLYQLHERKKYLERCGIKVKDNDIVLSQENNNSVDSGFSK